MFRCNRLSLVQYYIIWTQLPCLATITGFSHRYSVGRFNAVKFHPNTHKIHPIACPWGRGMWYILWSQPLIKFCLSRCSTVCNILYRKHISRKRTSFGIVILIKLWSWREKISNLFWSHHYTQEAVLRENSKKIQTLPLLKAQWPRRSAY